MNKFLNSTSLYGLMRPDDGAGAGAAADDDAAAAAAQADETAAADGADKGAAGDGAAAAAEPDKGADKGAAAAADAGAAAPVAKPSKAPKWAMDRIAEETEAKRQARQRAEKLEAEKQALEQLVEHLKKGSGGAASSGDATAQTQTIDTAATRVAAPPVDTKAIEERVRNEIRSEVQREQFDKDCNTIFANGTAEFKDFGDAVRVLQGAGVMQDDFLLDVLAADRENAHKIIHQLAEAPEEAIGLIRLSSRDRLAKLVRMASAAPVKPAPKKESNAPAPIGKTVAAVASQDEGDLSDDVSDDTWSQRFDKKFGLNGHATR